jgi:GntR family transcriptional regulator/MocR family aminotransferase
MIDSPVNTVLKQLIDFDKAMVQPVYIQVSQQIANAIQRKYLTKGTKLPGTRVLGQLLKVHRNTAVAIYEELASQGWVEVIPNKGTFILEPDRKTKKLKYYQKK